MRHQDLGLYSIRTALTTLRTTRQPTWELIAAICLIHFRDRFPQLPEYFKFQNTTGMMTLFFKEADRLTQELPEQMMGPHRPLDASEAGDLAARIVLLREAAIAANAIIFPAQAVRRDAVVVPIRRVA